MASGAQAAAGYGGGGEKAAGASPAVGRAAALKESMKQLLQSKAAAKAAAGAASSITKVDPRPRPPDGAARNQEFFQQMEKEYNDICKEDGWDQVRNLEKLGFASKEAEEQTRQPSAASEIPQGSDYFKVRVQPGKEDRQLRCDPDAARRFLQELPERSPMRNLDQLRRVEAATREAMEQEKERMAARNAESISESIRTESEIVRIETLSSDSEAAPADESDDDDEDVQHLHEVMRQGLAELTQMQMEEDAPIAPSAPIRTKSSVVNLDSLSDDEGPEPGESEEDRKKQENAIAALKALEEFDRLGREKEAMLAKYRDRYC